MTTPAQPIPLPITDGSAFTAIAYPMPGPPGTNGKDGARGPAGPQGPPGPASSGPGLWTGPGSPPEVILGARPGDTWLDTLTGDTYTLE